MYMYGQDIRSGGFDRFDECRVNLNLGRINLFAW